MAILRSVFGQASATARWSLSSCLCIFFSWNHSPVTFLGNHTYQFWIIHQPSTAMPSKWWWICSSGVNIPFMALNQVVYWCPIHHERKSRDLPAVLPPHGVKRAASEKRAWTEKGLGAHSPQLWIISQSFRPEIVDPVQWSIPYFMDGVPQCAADTSNYPYLLVFYGIFKMSLR